MPLLPLLFLGQDLNRPTLDAVLAGYRARTRAEIPCRTTSAEGEVVVCAKRTADRYRVPFVVLSPDRDDPNARLDRLLNDRVVQGITPCGQGAFTVKCGKVGVTMTTGFDGKTRLVTRELAP